MVVIIGRKIFIAPLFVVMKTGDTLSMESRMAWCCLFQEQILASQAITQVVTTAA